MEHKRYINLEQDFSDLNSKYRKTSANLERAKERCLFLVEELEEAKSNNRSKPRQRETRTSISSEGDAEISEDDLDETGGSSTGVVVQKKRKARIHLPEINTFDKTRETRQPVVSLFL